MPSPEWWETFFDEAYVEVWRAQGAFDDTAETAARLVELLGLPAGATVLDVPCGFGRFARPLHDAGLEVTGVDASADQVRLARRDNPGPTYVVGDMREPPAGPFDAVVNLFSSFGYLASRAEDRRCLEAWFAALRPGGQLVMETMHRDHAAWLFDPDGETEEPVESGVTDWAAGVRTVRVQVGGETRAFRLQLYSATELVGLLREVGFTDVDAWGDLAGTPLDPSTRLAIRARRPT